MTDTVRKRDLFALLLPGIWCLVLALCAFRSSNMIFLNFNLEREHNYQQKCQEFTAKVKSGEWELNKDKAIRHIQLSNASVTSASEACIGIGELMRAFEYLALIGGLLQLVVILHIRKIFGS